MYEIIFHGRGGQGALLAARILANAYFFEGKEVEAFPHFGGERRGAPVQAFLRINDKPIMVKSPITAADCSIILDPGLLEILDIAEGLKKDALIVLNTPLKPEEVQLSARFKLATCDATGISLKMIGKEIPNSAMLGAFSRADGLNLEALAKGFKEVFKNEAAAKKNIEMAEIAAGSTQVGVSSVEPRAKKSSDLFESKLEIGGLFKADGSSRRNYTSSWTAFRAVIDEGKCNACLICYALCPEGCVLRNAETVKVEEGYCKGCGICEEVCPSKAVSMRRKS